MVCQRTDLATGCLVCGFHMALPVAAEIDRFPTGQRQSRNAPHLRDEHGFGFWWTGIFLAITIYGWWRAPRRAERVFDRERDGG